ncbi:sulfurtransferase complex subunit TusD [Aliidiomarina sp. Khilg15.8]
MASFTLLVQHGPQQGHHSYSALQFAEAALQKGHRILQVFFYGDGVLHGNAIAHQPGDDQDISALWAKFSAKTEVPLVICATVAARHGVVAANELESFNAGNLATGYASGGLTEYTEALASSDHLVQF